MLGDGLGLQEIHELHRYAVSLEDLAEYNQEVPRRFEDNASLSNVNQGLGELLYAASDVHVVELAEVLFRFDCSAGDTSARTNLTSRT